MTGGKWTAALFLVGLACWLLVRNYRAPPPCTNTDSVLYATPIAAALSSAWRYPKTGIPAQLALNVPPSESLDVRDLGTDANHWHTDLILLQDTSPFARTMISPDSLRSLGTVYDVRGLADTDWFAIWNSFQSSFTDVDSLYLNGIVYRVAVETCRGWPCHGATYVEVRQSGGRYVGCRVLLLSGE
jgi:hypothetical protein